MQIEKLYNNSIESKSFDTREKELDAIVICYENILKKENLNPLNISICIDKMQTKVKKLNAQVFLLEDNWYEIVFCPKLLTVIDGLSIELTNKYKEYFSEINKDIFYDKNKRDKLQKYIYQYFINHIFYHELFHILRGHLKYLQITKSITTILEFEESNIKNLDNLFLEIDADKFASIHSLVGNLEILENIQKLGFDINQTFYIIFMSMNELFYIFHLSSKEPKTRKGHPILFDRTLLFSHYFMESLDNCKIKIILEKDNFNYKNVNRINELSVLILTKKYQLEELFNNSDVVELSEKYYKFLKDIELDLYSYKINEI